MVTLIVVVVATGVHPLHQLSCTVCTGFTFTALSVMLAVPTMPAVVAGTKSIAKEQLAPDAKLDGCEPKVSCGQPLLLSNANPGERLGFWPDAGTLNPRGALPMFVTATVCVLVEPICEAGKLSALVEVFTTRTPLGVPLPMAPPAMYRLPALSIATPLAISRRAGGQPHIPSVTIAAIPGYGGDDARRVHHADDIVKIVYDVHVVRTIDRYAHRIIQFRAGGRPIIPAIAGGAVARDRSDDASSSVNLRTRLFFNPRCKGCPLFHYHRRGIVQFRVHRRTIIPTVAGTTIAHNRSDDAASRCHLADAIIAAIGNVEIVGTIHRHPLRAGSLPPSRPAHYPRYSQHRRT